MTHVLRIAHLRIAHQVANPEVGKREGNHFFWTSFGLLLDFFCTSLVLLWNFFGTSLELLWNIFGTSLEPYLPYLPTIETFDS